MANYRFDITSAGRLDASTATESLSVRVYDALRDEILSGAVRPGTRLVRRTLSKRLGVSPVPVAEALLRLEMDGLVESAPLLGSRVVTLTIEEARDDAVLREAIECQAARVCAENASDAELAKLMAEGQRVDRLMIHGGQRSRIGMRAHLLLHVAIARYGGFGGLRKELSRVWFRRIMRLNWIKATQCKAVPNRWHEQLVEAVSTRDPEFAEARMREHVRYGCEDDAVAVEYASGEESVDG